MQFQKVSEYDPNVQSLMIKVALVYNEYVLEISKGFEEHLHHLDFSLNKSQESKLHSSKW